MLLKSIMMKNFIQKYIKFLGMLLYSDYCIFHVALLFKKFKYHIIYNNLVCHRSSVGRAFGC